MPVVITPISEFTEPIYGPATGDSRTAVSITQAVQPLANQSKYLKDAIDAGAFKTVTSTKPDTTAGAETSSLIHAMGQSATSRFWLLQSSTINGAGARLRIYQDAQQNGGLVITFNARWDAGTAQWAKDSTSTLATKFGMGSSGGLVIQFVDAGTAGPFSEASWNANLGLFGSDGARTVLALAGNLASSSAPAANTLYANSMVKAWASVTVVSSVITVNDAFNIGTPSIVGSTSLRLPFRTALANAQYCAVPASNSSFDFPRVSSATSSAVDLQLINSSTQAAVDLTANTRTFYVTVMGQQ